MTESIDTLIKNYPEHIQRKLAIDIKNAVIFSAEKLLKKQKVKSNFTPATLIEDADLSVRTMNSVFVYIQRQGGNRYGSISLKEVAETFNFDQFSAQNTVGKMTLIELLNVLENAGLYPKLSLRVLSILQSKTTSIPRNNPYL